MKELINLELITLKNPIIFNSKGLLIKNKFEGYLSYIIKDIIFFYGIKYNEELVLKDQINHV